MSVDRQSAPRVLILGRANVGKSTLFNRFLKHRRSVTTPQPGMTQDWLEALVRLHNRTVLLTDTAGVEPDEGWQKTDALIPHSSVILFVVEARVELTSIERGVAERLRGHKTIVVANKGEGLDFAPEPCFALGIERVVLVSGLHGQGMEVLSSAICDSLPAAEPHVFESAAMPASFSLALLGRPNTGKSTLANRLIGEQRMLVDKTAGTTRNAVSLLWRCGDLSANLVDTAGLRRAVRVHDAIEVASTKDSLRSMRESSLAALVCDARAPFHKQELRLAHRALVRGKPLMLLLNKWDTLDSREKRAFQREAKDTLQRLFPDFLGLPLITLSALYDKDLSIIFKTAMHLHALSTRRVATRRVNAWLKQACDEHPPPTRGGRRPNLRYATQVSAAPPRFKIFTNHTLERGYRRFLIASLRRYFDWPAVPIVLETMPKT